MSYGRDASKGPIFLIGTQRSGTTLLCRMMTAHPDIFIKNEVPVRSVFRPGASRDEIQQKISDSVERIFGQSLKALMAAEGKSIWGLKDPELTTYLEALKQFLPEARFIVITRDARAVVNSYMDNKWGLGTNAYTGALRWKAEVEKQLHFCDEYPGNTLRLRYEDLVLQQKESLSAICEFLGVEFHESMLRHESQRGFLRQTRENKKTFVAPDPEMTRKWKHQLTQHQIRLVDSVCGPLLEKLDYEAVSAGYRVPALLRVYYQVHQAII